MKELLERYFQVYHPEIRKIHTISTRFLKFIAMVTKNKKLKEVTEMFSYFGKPREMGNPEETWTLLGKPEITLEKWLQIKD